MLTVASPIAKAHHSNGKYWTLGNVVEMTLQRQSISAETAPASGAAPVPAGTARNGLLLAGSLVLVAVMILAEPATAAEHAPEKAGEKAAEKAGAKPEVAKPLDLEDIRDAIGRGEAKKAVLRRRGMAAGGNAEAQLLLGDLFMEGRGIYQNYSMAGNWYKKAAQAGNAESQFKLAGLYQKGLGVPLYLGRGRELLISAARQGHAEAIESLKKRGIEPPPMMVKEAEGSKGGKGKKAKEESVGPPAMDIRIAGMGPATDKIAPALKALVERYAAAVNSKDLAKLKPLIGPEYAACANEGNKAAYDDYLSDGLNFTIVPGYAVTFGPLSPQAALPFLDIVNYPVRPGHYVRIDLPAPPPRADQEKIEYGTTIIQPLVNADGKWSLALGCPTPLGIKRMRQSGLIGEG